MKQLNESLLNKLTLVSAPAGFGKTILVSEWVASLERAEQEVRGEQEVRAAWLSLNEGDNDLTRFLVYLVAALRTAAADIGEGVLAALQSPQPPPVESILTTLLNEITTIPDNFVLIMYGYHVIDSRPIDQALTFLIDNMPSQMHLVITTREEPNLPLARLRARGQLVEVRAADLCFTTGEAAEFLTQVMGLNLSEEKITALGARTEGWIAGLQLSALALQGFISEQGSSNRGDETSNDFIKSFTGGHHFVMDYLVEEVLRQQPASVQTFLLRTSILDHLCGPLCDAVLFDEPTSSQAAGGRATGGQATLEYLEHVNLVIVPLYNERRWYRYHQLFADLLRHRLNQSASLPTAEMENLVPELHRRASAWYENHGLVIEAFHHAAAANDVERAERLIEGKGMPLQFRGAGAPVMAWLESLLRAVLDDRPSLWVTYASTLLFGGKHTAVEQKLQAAEAAIAAKAAGPDDRTKDLVGRIASLRATLAVIEHDVETIITQSRSALADLHPKNLPVSTATTWTQGYGYQLQGDHAAARQAYNEVNLCHEWRIHVSNDPGDAARTLVLKEWGSENGQYAGEAKQAGSGFYERAC